jgi:hypothetical protein
MKPIVPMLAFTLALGIGAELSGGKVSYAQ